MKDWRIHHPIAVVDGTNRFFQSQSWTQVKPNVGVCRGDGSGLRTRSVVDDIVKTKIGGSQSLKVLLKERPCRHQCSVCVPYIYYTLPEIIMVLWMAWFRFGMIVFLYKQVVLSNSIIHKTSCLRNIQVDSLALRYI